MTALISARHIFLGAGLALLAGCGGGASKVATPGDTPAREAGWTSRKDIGEAIELLNKGDVDAARRLLGGVLQAQPGDPVARSLYNQIEMDPVGLLGKQSFAYTAREGDTFSGLAARFLGNPIMFYALARYNGITAAGALTPGRTLRIPGKRKAEPKPKDKEKPAAAAPKSEAPAKKPAATPAAPPAAATPAPAAKPRANPARVMQLRAQALEQMNRGSIDRAVGLLRQALAIDPANALVKRDLDRALRIQGAVRAR